MSFSPRKSRCISRFTISFRMLKFSPINALLFFLSFLISKCRYYSMSLWEEMGSAGERKQLGIATWNVNLFSSLLSFKNNLRKMFAPSRFWTLDTKLSGGKGHSVFLWVNLQGPKWHILLTLYTLHFMDIEIVSIVKKQNKTESWYFTFFLVLFFYPPASLACCLHLFPLCGPGGARLYFPDGFFLFSLKIESPPTFFSGCSNHHGYCLKKSWKY